MYGINPKKRYTLRVMPYAYGDYILAHARLHTNPSDWIEKSKPFDLLFSWLPRTKFDQIQQDTILDIVHIANAILGVKPWEYHKNSIAACVFCKLAAR